MLRRAGARAATLPRRAHGTRVWDAQAAATLRAQAAPASMLVAPVEAIVDRRAYDAYASANTAMLAPHASSLTVVSRAYASELPHFATLFCSPAPTDGSANRSPLWIEPVDRMPFVLCRGPGLLEWLGGRAYDDGRGSGNLPRRHAASGHANVYVLTDPTPDGEIGGARAPRNSRAVAEK